jgi:hypothetical protein
MTGSVGGGTQPGEQQKGVVFGFIKGTPSLVSQGQPWQRPTHGEIKRQWMVMELPEGFLGLLT